MSDLGLAAAVVFIPDGHPRTGHPRKLHRTGETLVTLRIVVFEADLQLDRLEEVSLFLVEGVVEQRLHIRAHSGYPSTLLVCEGGKRSKKALDAENPPTVIFDMS